jgi:hypothetical protein
MTRAGNHVAVAGVLCTVLVLAQACGGDGDSPWSRPAKGAAMLPDLAPVPPSDIHTKKTGDGWTVEFSSTVVNVGEGDFHATINKGPVDTWTVTQDIAHEEGAEHVRTPAELIWAGDGHEHWHIKRYVTYHLFALDAQGQPTGEERTDHKIGFCIYDFRRADTGTGPDEPVYGRDGCGKKDSTHLVMGLTPGWADYYSWNLPGQSISIDDLPDGRYRIFADADEAGMFREASTDNNETWVDFTLSTDEQGTRFALVDDVGPAPE